VSFSQRTIHAVETNQSGISFRDEEDVRTAKLVHKYAIGIFRIQSQNIRTKNNLEGGLSPNSGIAQKFVRCFEKGASPDF